MKHRFLIVTALATALAVAGAVGLVTAGEGGAATLDARTTSAAAAWPGTTGKSGVNGVPLLDTASVQAFCDWRGRACGVAQTYTDRTSWQSMTAGSDWLFDGFADFPGQLVISQGLTPDNGTSADLTACANGQHNQDWRNFGTLMTQKGRPASIVRLGWEFNGTYMAWSALNTQTWINCYRNAATNIRVTDPQVILDWTINSHGTPAQACGGVSTNCYPGDDVVDIVGIDNYDMYPAAGSLANFTKIANAADGLNWLYSFAVAHNKKFSVGEWGVAPGATGGNSIGEDPQFIQWMHDWFAAHATNLAYEAYFDTCDPGDVESNIYLPVSSTCARINTKAATLYKSLFGA
jgi:hypothetical protein